VSLAIQFGQMLLCV